MLGDAGTSSAQVVSVEASDGEVGAIVERLSDSPNYLSDDAGSPRIEVDVRAERWRYVCKFIGSAPEAPDEPPDPSKWAPT